MTTHLQNDPVHSPQATTPVQRYEQAVNDLTTTSGHLPASSIFNSLCLRDAVDRWLDGNEMPIDSDSLDRLVKADMNLRRLSPRLAALAEMSDWRQTLAPSAEAWWWFPGHEESGRWKAWSLLFGCLTASLVLEIGARFGPNKIDLLGGALVVFPTILAALSAGGALSKTIENSLRSWLSLWGVPSYRQPATFAWIAAGVFATSFITWLALPRISVAYNDRGAAALKTGRPAEAEAYLQRALRLDPNNGQAHYNLGELQEHLEHRTEAIREYGLAAASGLDLAANNLGRLLILENRPDAAVQILLQLEQQTRDQVVEPTVRYAVLKNLGWARVAQGRYAEAIGPLEEARRLAPNAAPAHCLLGRAFMKLGNSGLAAKSWTDCLASARYYDADEDRWIGEADQFFEESGL